MKMLTIVLMKKSLLCLGEEKTSYAKVYHPTKGYVIVCMLGIKEQNTLTIFYNNDTVIFIET